MVDSITEILHMVKNTVGYERCDSLDYILAKFIKKGGDLEINGGRHLCLEKDSILMS